MKISTQAKKGLFAGAVLLLVGVGAYALIFGTKGTPSSVGVRVETDRGGQKGLKAEPGVSGDGVRVKEERQEGESQPASIDQARILKQAIKVLEDEHADTAELISAILSLRKVFSREAVELLRKFLASEDDAVLAEAIDTLGVIGLESEQRDFVFNVLLEKAKDENFLLRGPALITAAMMGEHARILPVIAQFIAEEGIGSKDYAVRALASIATPECVPLAKDLLEKTNDWEILREVYALLTKIDSPEADQLIRSGLYSEDEDKQYQSAWALSRSVTEKNSASLIEAVSTKGLSKDALGAVAQGPAGPAVFESVLSDANIDESYRLKLFNILASNLQTAPGMVRNSFAETMHRFINSSDSAVQVAALNTIAKAAASTDQTPVITSKLQSEDLLVKGAALQAFFQYCTPETYTPLKALWYDNDAQIRRTAFFFSEAFMTAADLPDLEKATNHSDEFIKKQAMVMIKYLTPIKQTY